MKIPFEPEYREQYYRLLDEVFDSNFLSEGGMVHKFEQAFTSFTGIPSLALSSGGAGLLALYEYIGVEGGEVIVPANTFWASAAAAKRAGARVIYADCNREDLCLSLDDLKRKVTPKTKAVTVVHIGGHIAFRIEEIAAFCREREITLVEDCAHAHGASWNGKVPGSWGLGGAYSFYATKTMPLGDGGMVVSRNPDFLEWLKLFRNYGKKVQEDRVRYEITNGFNFRMNEVTAAFGLVQLERLPGILNWKRKLARKFDRIFERRVRFPSGMQSGCYKYIVFDYQLKEETGKVFNTSDFGNEIEGVKAELPNSYWIARHHACVPIWYGWPGSDTGLEKLKVLLLG
jgi:perosamine synthetase